MDVLATLETLRLALAAKTETPKEVLGETVVSEVQCFCAKCGKELTDAVSKDHGVGPDCRMIENATLALWKSANVPAARATLAKLTAAEIPAAAAATAAKVVEAVAAGALSDWRETVKRIEWTLSRGVWGSTKDLLCDVIRHLGYPTLANLLTGAAVSGKAAVTVEGGRIVLVAPNKPAARAAIKAIPGRMFHPAGTLKAATACWSVPAREVRRFWDVLTEYYPNHDATLLKLVAECAKVVEAAAAATPAEAKVAAKVAPSVSVAPGKYNGIEIGSPYNAEFVNGIKLLPYNERKWIADRKVWWVSATAKATALALIEKVYGAGAVKEVEAA